MQTAQRNSLRLLQWMMVASLALPLALFVFASAISWVSIRDTADREIERALDVAHEHALKVFETIDRSLSEIAEIVRAVSDADIVAREQALHLRLKQLVASLPQVKSAWVFDAKGQALVNSLVVPAPEIDFSDRDYFKVHVASDGGSCDIALAGFAGRVTVDRHTLTVRGRAGNSAGLLDQFLAFLRTVGPLGERKALPPAR